jgi:DNA modification methylase
MKEIDLPYNDFLLAKVKNNIESGFEISTNKLNKNLFEFQKHIVKTALKVGKYAIFAETGLGKTIMQMAWAEEVYKKTNKPVLILAPLAVSGQTIEEGKKFNIDIHKYDGNSNIQIINYEQLDNIDISIFAGIVLDESSILKNFTGKLRTQIIDLFKDTPYKLACTATPSPNDLMELGNHSEFLNKMSRTEMLSMYFVHDGGDTSKWRLKGHAKKDFYAWIGTWACVITNPKDLDFEEEGIKFQLPELNYFEYRIITPKKDDGLLFNDTAVNAIDFNKELRETKEIRLSKVKQIIDKNKNEYFIIWINQNEEGDYLKQLLKGYDFREVRGSDSVEKKENDLIEFSQGKYKILITKSKIAGQGMNFQHCHNQIFAALDFSFEKLYQSVRRSYRFGQKENVNIYLITTDTMTNVIELIKTKEKIFQELREEMQNIINYERMQFVMHIDTSEDFINDNVKLLKGDCVQRIKEIESNSIGYSIFSPPFSSLYTYSDHLEDMGNSKDYNTFFIHFEFLIKELYRVLIPGRLVSFHCMNLPISKQSSGYIGINDFRGDLIRAFQKENFIYHSEVCIWKDPVVAMQRTKALGLLHKQVKKDSSMCRQGIPDYLVTMRKPGDNPNPISGEFDHFCGDMQTFKNTGNVSIDIWQRYASPVWMDIKPGNTLQYRSAREDNDERHICPLQLDVIHRGLQLWSKKEDIVFTPFMGIGSEIYEAIKLNRRGIGIELKESYFNQAVKNIQSAIESNNQDGLFNSTNIIEFDASIDDID